MVDEKEIKKFLEQKRIDILTEDENLKNSIIRDIVTIIKNLKKQEILKIQKNFDDPNCSVFMDPEVYEMLETKNFFWTYKVFNLATLYIKENNKPKKRIKAKQFRTFCLKHLDNILYLLQYDEEGVEEQLKLIEQEVLAIRKQITTGSVVYGSKVDK